jgi:hypothetical protein
MPSLKPPIPPASTAKPAALERRLEGGGVALLWGFDGSGIVSLSEADRLTVTTEDEEMELDRDDWRRCGGPAGSEGCCEGAASGLKMFMAREAGGPVSRWVSQSAAKCDMHGIQPSCKRPHRGTRCRNAMFGSENGKGGGRGSCCVCTGDCSVSRGVVARTDP